MNRLHDAGIRARRMFARALCALTLIVFASGVSAEGSRTLYPVGYAATPTTCDATHPCRADMDLQAPGTRYAGVTARRQFLYVYAKTGEFILLGSSNRSTNTGADIFVYNPQSFAVKGNETVPGAASFTCSATGTFSGTGKGYIAARAQELAGPNSADGTGTVTNGWAPCAYQAPSTGIYGVLFTVNAGGGGPSGLIDTGANFATGSQTVAAWEVQVRSSASSIADINGRLFTYAWVAFTGGNTRPVDHVLYYATLDGARYRQIMRGLDPNGYALWANVSGFIDQGQPLYKDLRGNDNVVDTGVDFAELSAQQPQEPIFFSDIDPAGANASEVSTVLGALSIPSQPLTPVINNPQFNGLQSGNQTYHGSGGTFTFVANNDTSYQIVISRGTDFDPGNTANVTLTGLAPDGFNSVVWNGLANDGTVFPNGTFNFQIIGRNGEIHFPIIDSEGNASGGPSVIKLNGLQSGSATVYFDDRGYVTHNNVPIGTLNGALCGAALPTPPTPDHALTGTDSNTGPPYYRAWPGNGNSNTDCNTTAGFGDAKALDLWTFQQTPSQSAVVIINPEPTTTTLATQVSVPPQTTPGATVYGTFSFQNVGDTAATGVTYGTAAGQQTVVLGTPGNCPTGITFDLLPAGVTFTNYNAATCVATFTGMPTTLAGATATTEGQSLVFNFHYTAPATGTIPVSTDVNATNSTNHPTASGTTVVISSSADLAIVKTDGSATYTPGGAISYTLTVTDNGPGNANSFNITDVVPATITGVSVTCAATGTAACGTNASSGNNVAVNGSSISVGAGNSVTVTVSGTVVVSMSGPLTNVASVVPGTGATFTDPNGTNDTSSDTDTAAPQADLSITKTDGVTTVTPGGSTTYTITASNAGPSNAPGATVTDTFPATLTATWTCVGAGGGTCTASGSGNINDTVNLPVGGSVTYTVSATISAAAAGTLSNTATVTPPAAVPDPNPANNTATDTDTISAQADLAITKTDGVTTVTAGGTTTYTITASNAGPSAAPGALVTDTFPAALTATWTCVGAGGGTCTSSGSGNISDTVNLPVGGSVTYTVSTTISAAATGTLSNTATVTPPAAVTDPNPTNNTATDTDTIAKAADLSITKTDGVTTVTAGGTTTYTIVATNAGPSNVLGATVADTFPATLTATWTCVGAGGGTCTASGSGNINDTVNLPVGASVSYTVSASISPSATGTLSNTATVTPPAGVTDPTPANNSATDTDTLGASADLAITKTDGVTNYTPGGNLTYTIVASNNGPSAVTGATITDTFPASLTTHSWTAVASGGATGFSASGSGNINDTVNMPNGSTITYTVNATVSAAATGSLTNTATIAPPASVSDPNPTNNTSTDTDTQGATPQLSIAKSAIPTAFIIGQPGTYTLAVGNTGSVATSGTITVSDNLPAGITTTATPSGTNWNCSSSTTTVVTCTTATAIAAGGSAAPISVPIAVAANAAPSATNTAIVTGGGDPGCTTAPLAANCTTTINTPVGSGSADLHVVKTGPATIQAGQNIVYTIAVTNIGPDPALNAVLTDPAPAGLSFVSSGAPCPTFPCSLGNIAVNQTITIPNVTFLVAANYGTGTITNTASVTSDTPDPTPINNSSSASTPVVTQGQPSVAATPIDARWMLAMMIALLSFVGARRARGRRG